MSELPPEPEEAPESEKSLADHTPPEWIVKLAVLHENEDS